MAQESENKKKSLQINDRKLGDEWIDWRGDVTDSEKDTNTRKRVFLSILLILLFGSGATAYFIWYLITPRLAQFHPSLPTIFGIVLLFIWGIFVFLFFFMVLSIFTQKNFFMRFGGREFPITFLVPIVMKIGLYFGISRDRLSNSFVKISNILIKASTQKVKPEKLLILLPRCLQKSIIQRINQFSKKFHIPVFTVPGGEKARQIVYKLKPNAIIGVACERDLLSGIQDISDQIPVIGIPNIRPEGPCKNTIIDIRDFEDAVQTFLGSDVTIFNMENDSDDKSKNCL